LWLVNEKQLFIAEKQSFLVTGSLAGHSENLNFNQPEKDSQCFSVDLSGLGFRVYPKRTLKVNLLLLLGC
jgi:hypothetical protein